jgi:hypothetical protein
MTAASGGIAFNGSSGLPVRFLKKTKKNIIMSKKNPVPRKIIAFFDMNLKLQHTLIKFRKYIIPIKSELLTAVLIVK